MPQVNYSKLMNLLCLFSLGIGLLGVDSGFVVSSAYGQNEQRASLQEVEIEGVDLDGVPFRLSDYRGKVVFLDFWGDW